MSATPMLAQQSNQDGRVFPAALHANRRLFRRPGVDTQRGVARLGGSPFTTQNAGSVSIHAGDLDRQCLLSSGISEVHASLSCRPSGAGDLSGYPMGDQVAVTQSTPATRPPSLLRTLPGELLTLAVDGPARQALTRRPGMRRRAPSITLVMHDGSRSRIRSPTCAEAGESGHLSSLFLFVNKKPRRGRCEGPSGVS